MKNILLVTIFAFVSMQYCYSQSAGFNQTYVIINNNYYDLNATTANPDFNGANFGSFCQGATTGLTFNGAEHNNWKCGGCDITSTRIFYNIHTTGGAIGSFVSNNIPYTSDFGNGCGGRDQKWSKTDYSTNLLSGLAAGNYTIEVYSEESTSCSGTVYASNGGANYKATFTVTTPTVAAITGNTNVCVNASTTLLCATPSGVWSNSGTNATVGNTGNVQVNSAGTFTVYYTVTDNNGCTNNSSVVLQPSLPTSSTTNQNICPGGSYSFNGTTYTNAGTYTAHLNNAAGCDSAATLVLTLLPSIPSITGSSSVCVGSSINMSNTIDGGVWNILTNRATINSSGALTGKYAGNTVVTYTLSTNSCTGTVTKNITVNTIPSVPTINYAPGTPNPQIGAPTGAFCVGKTFNVIGSPAGGSWSATGVASITLGGTLTINSVGSGSLKYTYTNASGCSNSRTMVGTGFTCAAKGINNTDPLVSSNSFTIYPNPARSTVSINIETLVSTGNIIITDLFGKEIKRQSLSIGKNIVDVASFSKGLYFISIITSEGKNTRKLILE